MYLMGIAGMQVLDTVLFSRLATTDQPPKEAHFAVGFTSSAAH